MAKILPCEICGHSKRAHDSISCNNCDYRVVQLPYEISFFHEYKMNNLIYLENKLAEKEHG